MDKFLWSVRWTNPNGFWPIQTISVLSCRDIIVGIVRTDLNRSKYENQGCNVIQSFWWFSKHWTSTFKSKLECVSTFWSLLHLWDFLVLSLKFRCPSTASSDDDVLSRNIVSRRLAFRATEVTLWRRSRVFCKTQWMWMWMSWSPVLVSFLQAP